MSKDLNPIQKAQSLLNILRSKQRQIDIISGVVLVCTGTLFIFGSILLLEILYPTTTIFRRIYFLSLIILPAISTILVILRIVFSKHLRKGWISDHWWALRIGKISPGKIRDRLLNAIEINRASPTSKDNFSSGLAHAALLNILSEVDDVPVNLALNKTQQRLLLKLFALAMISCIGIFSINPASSLSAIIRIVHPNTEYRIEASVTFTIDPAGGWVYKGEKVVFEVVTSSSFTSEALFNYKYDNGEIQDEIIRFTNNIGTIEFEGFNDPVNYWISYKDYKSNQYRLDIVKRPLVAELNLKLYPPKYTGLPIERGPENTGNAEVLPGTRMELEVFFNKPVESGWCIFSRSNGEKKTSDTLSFETNGIEGNFSTVLMKEADYHIRIQDRHGHFNKEPINYRIKMLSDDAPSVRIAFPEGDVELGDSPFLPLKIEAEDDFGISRMRLDYRVISQDSTISQIALTPENSGSLSISYDYFWDIGDEYLMPGDVVEYWVSAWDNDNVLGPKKSESERRLLRLPSLEEIFSGIEESEAVSFEQAEATMEKAQELEEALSEIIEELKRNPEMDWEKRQQVNEVMEKQGDLEKQVEELAKSIEKLTEQMEENNLADDETLEKYRQLQELIAEIATPELKAAMEKLRKAMEEQDPDKIRQALEDFEFNQEEFRENLERSMDILKQLQLEHRLDELVNQTEKILNEQEQIIEKMDDKAEESLAKQQDNLSQSMETLEKRIEETSNLAEESGENDLHKALKEISEEVNSQEIPESMQNASKDLKNSDKKSARSKSEQNARKLTELASNLSKVSDSFKENKKNELAGKIRRVTEELLFLSNEQEELAVKSRELNTSSPRYRDLSGNQNEILGSLNSSVNSLFEISKETFFITPEIGASLGKASEAAIKAVEGYVNRFPKKVAKPQQQAMGEMNKAIKQLIDILAQLQGSASSTGYEEMMQRLSEMAASQQQLNQQSGMPMPGQEGSQTMPGGDKSLSQMAAQQKALQQQAEKMGEDAQGMEQILGDLEGIAKSMGEVSEDMENQNISQRTRRLQRQIVSRLLDATRSARQKEYSQKRESKSGNNAYRKPPPNLKLNTEKDKLQKDLMRALQEGYTRDYRRLIRDYFHALEKLEKVEEDE